MDEISTLLATLKRNNHRALVVLSGSEQWGQQQACSLVAAEEKYPSLWVGDQHYRNENIPAIKASKVMGWLGRELELIVFNAFSGFDVDAFGAISGSLKGGGLFILLVPELNGWPSFNDPEHQRLAVYPKQASDVTGYYLSRLSKLIEEEHQLSLICEKGDSRWQTLNQVQTDKVSDVGMLDSSGSYPCRTQDQVGAVDAIIRVAKGHRRRPLVLTADRGRGKSAALGIAAAQLLGSGLNTIHVTAPSLASADILFQHAALLLEGAEVVRGSLEWQGKALRFYAPDELLHSYPSACDLMLVDEAAAIPVPVLTQLLKQHSRIVFSSTQHGYEGTGRGFAIKFRKILDKMTPKWKGLHLKQAIRWSENDPFEAFVFKALMLDAVPASEEFLVGIELDQCEFVSLPQQQLIKDDQALSDLFGLLILAHYRTRPFDLRHLLDGPNIEIYGLKYHGRVIATVLTALEGGIDSELEEAIWLGKRRVRGHLIPQSLSNHSGVQETVQYQGLRVIRIAVHPSIQAQGLGSFMLEKLSEEASLRGLDYLGSSFGATSDLIPFWKKADYAPVRTGLTREASSGCYSVIVLKPVSERFNPIMDELRSRFYASFILLLPDVLREMDPDLVRLLLQGHSESSGWSFTGRDSKDLKSFAYSDRLYESCLPAIRSLLIVVLSNQKFHLGQSPERIEGLIAKVLQSKSWKELAEKNGLVGRKQTVQWLRDGVAVLLKEISV